MNKEASSSKGVNINHVSLLMRLLAKVIDTAIACFLSIAIILVFSGVLAYLPQMLKGIDSDLMMAILIIPYAIAVIYLLFSDAFPGGRSFGKRVTGLSVVSDDGSIGCSISQSFTRNSALIPLAVIEAVIILVGSKKRLGDMFAKTRVIKGK